MESDEEDQNEDIGTQDGQATGTAQQAEAGATDESQKKRRPPKKTQEERKEEKKQYGPPQQRSKTNRGDYVVTSFVIPERSIGQDSKVSTQGNVLEISE